MATIVTRAGKGSALTHTEMDANFTNLNAEVSLVSETEVTGSAVTSVDITDLDMNTDKSYRVEIEWANPVGGASLRLYINGDNTNSNYYAQQFLVDDTTVVGSRVNIPNIAFVDSAVDTFIVGTVGTALDNRCRSQWQSNDSTGATTAMRLYEVISTTQFTNITQMTFTAQSAGAIGVGTKIRIYRGTGR
jgi:hypothetical protein